MGFLLRLLYKDAQRISKSLLEFDGLLFFRLTFIFSKRDPCHRSTAFMKLRFPLIVLKLVVSAIPVLPLHVFENGAVTKIVLKLLCCWWDVKWGREWSSNAGGFLPAAHWRRAALNCGISEFMSNRRVFTYLSKAPICLCQFPHRFSRAAFIVFPLFSLTFTYCLNVRYIDLCITQFCATVTSQLIELAHCCVIAY